MLKKEIPYEDWDGNQQVGTFYFNLTRAEVLEMAVDDREGKDVQDHLRKIIEAQDKKQLIAEFKNFIMLAYGERDGDLFKKSDEISLRFTQHPAYDALFWEMTTDDTKFAEFINGLLPKEIAEDAMKQALSEADEIKSKILSGADEPTKPSEFSLPPPAPTS